MRRSHTILVALDVVPTTDQATAQRLVEVALGDSLLNPEADSTVLESWHFADDDRTDGTDDHAQSAVFCRRGCQEQARAVLVAAGLA